MVMYETQNAAGATAVRLKNHFLPYANNVYAGGDCTENEDNKRISDFQNLVEQAIRSILALL